MSVIISNRPDFTYANQLDNVHELHQKEMMESLGTLQIGEYSEAIGKLVDDIIEDIRTKEYINHKITREQINEMKFSHFMKDSCYIPEKLNTKEMFNRLYETTEYDYKQPYEETINYFKHIEGLTPGEPLYILEYFPNNISWLYKLVVVINPSVNNYTKNVDAVAYPHNPVLTNYTDNIIEKMTININICHSFSNLKDDIIHEIRHYYEDFLEKASLKKYYDGQDKIRIDHNSKEIRISKDFLIKHPGSFYNFEEYPAFCTEECTNNKINVIYVIINFMYWCSKREVGPHTENIATEIKKYMQENELPNIITVDYLMSASRTYRVYHSINKIANYYKENVPIEISDQIYKTKIGKLLEDIYFKHYARRKNTIQPTKRFHLKLVRDVMTLIIQRTEKIMKNSASLAEYFLRKK